MRRFRLIGRAGILCLFALPSSGQSTDCQPVVDMHLHVYTAESFWGPLPNIATGVLGPANVEDHLNQTLRELEMNHVPLAMASAPLAWQNPDPERLWHSLDVQDPDEIDLAALTEAVESGRIKAIGEIGAQYQGISPADARWTPIYELAETHGLPVGIHTGGGPSGIVFRGRPKFRYEYGNPFLLQDVLLAHPRLKVYMMHAGLDLYAREALAMMHMYPKLYVDIGVATWVQPFMKVALQDFLEQAIFRDYGDRILFGSDQMVWPSAISMAAEAVQTADYLTEQQKQAIFFDNAAAFLGLDDAQKAALVERACSPE